MAGNCQALPVSQARPPSTALALPVVPAPRRRSKGTKTAGAKGAKGAKGGAKAAKADE